ncbi:hypothetical protein F4821DRAFT_143911 [Hypoxylon rubiginosum]|uniref:Uncharacterized protein n=1 Tax=Hypoxylon rubiginosum TaxID=110542 RepID=A0ACC0D0K6_9PEZI|nr:hypothetical protein F4821DRAFT_143911 [Hypoxylon rubiginosum]
MPRRPRTRRTNQDTFTRPSPAAVTYDLSERRHATIRVPPGSAWTSGPHWHVAHTEFLQVLSGTALVTLAGLDLRVEPGDDVVMVPRGVVHEWRRADVDPWRLKDSEELVVREWTEPSDGAKEVFFRNLNGLILDEAASNRSEGGSSWSGALLELELWNLFWRADNYPVVLGLGGGWIGAAATRVLMGAAVALGWVLGRPGVYDEYCAR